MIEKTIEREELTDEQIDQGMFPELGAKTITITNKQFNVEQKDTYRRVFGILLKNKRVSSSNVEKWEIKISELPVFYVKEFNLFMKPFYGILNGNIDAVSLMDPKKISEMENNLLEPAWYIVNYHSKLSGVKIAKRDLELNCAEAKLLEIIYTQLEVNGYVNFFKKLFQGLIATLAGMQMSQKETS